MSVNNCKCKHPDKQHSLLGCKSCVECNEYQPGTESHWLNAPDGPGHWFHGRDGAVFTTTIAVDEDMAYYTDWIGRHMPGHKWQRIPTPTSPAPSLPKSRDVTLTARVWEESDGGWRYVVETGSKMLKGYRHKTKSEALAAVREYGIEPTVEGEE